MVVVVVVMRQKVTKEKTAGPWVSYPMQTSTCNKCDIYRVALFTIEKFRMTLPAYESLR